MGGHGVGGRESRPWFVRRQAGLGWRPATWQGSVVTGVFVAVVIAGVLTTRITRSRLALLVVAVDVAIYVGVIAVTSRQRRAHVEAPAEVTPRATVQAARTWTAEPEPSPSAGPAALEVDGLTKRFGERVAFDDVSFRVAAGEVFGFLGPNGAGKTTTVRTLGTLIAPTAGTATVAGIPLTPHNGQAIRERIAIMSEAPGLYLRLSVRENLEFFAGLFSIAGARSRIDAALEAVNMTSRAGDLCSSLSKGLRQRVGLARALLNDPEVLFLDEPTSGLDPVAAREVHELIDGLRRRGRTVFLTTHRLEEAERLCDRVAILNTTLRMVGRPEDLRTRLFSRSLIVATAAPLPDAGGLFAHVDGVEQWQADGSGRYVLTVTDPKAVAPAVTRALVAAGADVEAIQESRHSLEDVYMELISEDTEGQAR